VGSTPQGKIVGPGLATGREWKNVMNFQEPAFGATALRSYECAPSTVTRPDDALDRGRDRSGLRSNHRPTVRPLHSCELPPFELLDEERQRAVDDGGDVAIRNRVPKEILGATQSVVELA
jgi:hypothetical protein